MLAHELIRLAAALTHTLQDRVITHSSSEGDTGKRPVGLERVNFGHKWTPCYFITVQVKEKYSNHIIPGIYLRSVALPIDLLPSALDQGQQKMNELSHF